MSSRRKPKPRALQVPNAQKASLENWLILRARLKEVENATSELVATYANAGKGRTLKIPAEKASLIRPLYCFAVVTYMRCFGGGRRPALEIDGIPKLTIREREAHQEAYRLRNKHFAHAVADEEGASILAIPPQQDIEAGFMVIEVTVATPSVADIKAFLALVKKVHSFVVRKEHEAGDVLAKSIFGNKATWAEGLSNGVKATGGNA